MKNVLVIAPHFDDEVLGFGGIIQKHVARNDTVTVCIVKKSLDLRSKVQESNTEYAKKYLGYHNLVKLNIELDLCNFSLDKAVIIETFIKQNNFTTLYMPYYGDQHQEHRGLFNIIKVVGRNDDIGIKEYICGEIISSTGSSLESHFNPNLYIEIDEKILNNKIQAMNCYKEELRPTPHPRSEYGIMHTAIFRGMQSGVRYAEAFKIIKKID
jgi:LmbE family N-acetylglucosaminyl deacetylase